MHSILIYKGKRQLNLILLMIGVGGFYFNGFSQNDTSVVGNIMLIEDSRVLDLMNYLDEHEGKDNVTNGYKGFRIQLLFSSSRERINEVKKTFYQLYPNQRVHTIYQQPYYKLRVGDFINKLDATNYLHQIIPNYPNAFIVRDRIE